MSFDQRAALKGVQWELAKGHLRAMVAIDGAIDSGEKRGTFPFQIVSARVEAFISEVEAEGLHL